MIDARLVVKAIQEARRYQLDKTAITLLVFAQQDEMVRAFRIRSATFVIVRCDVNLAADDGLHTVNRGLVIKIRGGEEIAVVRYGYCRHSPARGFGRQL